ncbi:unnamed protein product [Camellia sinensis]
MYCAGNKHERVLKRELERVKSRKDGSLDAYSLPSAGVNRERERVRILKLFGCWKRKKKESCWKILCQEGRRN